MSNDLPPRTPGAAGGKRTHPVQFERTIAPFKDRKGQPVTIVVVIDEHNIPYSPINSLCTAFWISDHRAQRDRITEHAVLRNMTRTLAVSTRGGRQEMLCLQCRGIGFWLGMVNANKVNPLIKDTLIALQIEIVDLAERALVKSVSERAPDGARATLEMTTTAALSLSQLDTPTLEQFLAYMQFMHQRISAVEASVGVIEDQLATSNYVPEDDAE